VISITFFVCDLDIWSLDIICNLGFVFPVFRIEDTLA